MIIKIFFLLVIIQNYTSIVFSQNNWVNQSSGISTRLYSVYFINSNTGWASGDSGKIIKTTNGGSEWFIQNSTTSLPLLNIMFADANTGWAAGGFDDFNPLCYHSVILLKTNNGGNSWIQQISGAGFLFNDLFVVNAQKAYITNTGICCPPFCIVESGALSFTNNSGLNWSSSLGLPSRSVFFLNENTGWVSSTTSSDVQGNKNYIHKTTDGSVSWSEMYEDSTWTYFTKITFINELTGYAHKQSLVKTTNAGADWFSSDSIITNSTTNNYFINSDTGWCTGGGGKIIRTDNGGLNWTSQISNTGSHLTSVHFIDALTGWAVGFNGTVIKTVTGGLTSVNQTSGIIDSFILNQNFPNPFNPNTTIQYSLSEKSFVTLKVYDVKGNEIAALVNEKQDRGNYSVQFSTVKLQLSSGIYFYRLEAGSFVETKRMMLLK